ncbi:MAG TPA: alternative ribosome rescue aminoacyl-tRNA hydrolase ArfB [Mycobacteriales bacterium]|jgi:ribosome-associated protein|nr:alternative ribosome rescue aminoacyl-tRNA hydrolase ArfB [Mycobacteriales bacterium]
MPGPLVVNDRLSIPEGELRWRFSRSSGPGGQSVNTADSRVELSLDVARSPSFPAYLRDRAVQRLASRLVDGVVTVAAEEHRSQLRNREAAMQRLADLLADATAPPAPPRRPTRPTKSAQQRRLDAKRKDAQTKRLRRPPAEE